MAATQPPLQYAMQTDADLENKLCQKGLKGVSCYSQLRFFSAGSADLVCTSSFSLGGVFGMVWSVQKRVTNVQADQDGQGR